jgi:hypothetical protein
LASPPGTPPAVAPATTAPIVPAPPRVQASSSPAAGAPATEAAKPGSDEYSGLGTTVLIIGALTLATAVWKKLAKAADRRRRIKWTCEYINSVNQSRYFPAFPSGSTCKRARWGCCRSQHTYPKCAATATALAPVSA